ncbi:hypothetical protein MSAN_01914100 [Mycena sanguinolenta]|uniref:von Hippel-Lindau disease tumour suppressor beta domain-containing protein n=1 Tax=Mycena sanguinolenta TaxID=230812 RepID=A0A8H6XPU9_9AGAR|nr:hypothetical protein MSAN_01914100 [Mycena sanguinolenta]
MCFCFVTRPCPRPTITFINNLTEDVTVSSEGKVIGTLKPAERRQLSAIIGQTFQATAGNTSQRLHTVARQPETVVLQPSQAAPPCTAVATSLEHGPRLFPIPHNRDISGLRSINSNAATAINFINETMSDAVISWINYQGLREQRQTLKSRASVRESTYVSHPWEVVVAGSTIQYLPTTTGEFNVVIGSAVNPTLSPRHFRGPVSAESHNVKGELPLRRPPPPARSHEDLDAHHPPVTGDHFVRLDGEVRVPACSSPSFRYSNTGREYFLNLTIQHLDYLHVSPNGGLVVQCGFNIHPFSSVLASSQDN